MHLECHLANNGDVKTVW